MGLYTADLHSRPLMYRITQSVRRTFPNCSQIIEVDVDLREVDPLLPVVSVSHRHIAGLLTTMLADCSLVGPRCEHVDMRCYRTHEYSGSRFVQRVRAANPLKDCVIFDMFVGASPSRCLCMCFLVQRELQAAPFRIAPPVSTACRATDESLANWLSTDAKCPIVIGLAELSRDVRLSPGGQGLLGYMPSVSRPTKMKKAVWKRLKPVVSQVPLTGMLLTHGAICSALGCAQAVICLSETVALSLWSSRGSFSGSHSWITSLQLPLQVCGLVLC
jgi:hypothetical protein